MVFDLNGFTYAELQQLQSELAAELETRKRAELQKTIADLRKLAADRGFSLGELIEGGEALQLQKQKRAPAKVKYRNPANAEQQWTGRGHQPLWVKQHLQSGGTLDALAV